MYQQISDFPITYPERDGQPMSDNTLQFRWIVTIKENLELLFIDRPDVFIAGDLLWYPIAGDNKIRQAPDAMVVIGRPKGDRGSYRQWEEGGIAPQVVFEILSPGNRLKEMHRKLMFYQQYGVKEYYIYDPDDYELMGWQRGSPDYLNVIPTMNNWVSPLLQIRFVLDDDGLRIDRPDGRPFLTFTELGQAVEHAQAAADRERQRSTRLIAQLRALGVEPDLES
jgi:Uma2 family endonuclease